MTDIIIAIVSGSLGATLVKIIGDSLAFRRERKAKKRTTAKKTSKHDLKRSRQKQTRKAKR